MNIKTKKAKNQVNVKNSSIKVLSNEEISRRIEKIEKNLTAHTWRDLETNGKFEKNDKLTFISDEMLIVGCDIGSETHYVRAIDVRGRELSEEVFGFSNNEEGLRDIWHNAKLRGRGYSRAKDIVSYAKTSVGLTDGTEKQMEQTRFEQGIEQLRKIDGIGGENVIKSLEDIAPDVGKYIIEFAFGDIYPRKELNLQEREMITITSLLTAGGCEPQLEVHINGSLNVGIAPEKIIETFIQCIPYTGFPKVLNAIFVAKKIFAERGITFEK